MTPSKHKMLLKQQTAVAQKVFEHVTSESSITVGSISSSIIREAKFRVDTKTLTGILDSLKDCGLIKEGLRGQFIRVVPREQTIGEAAEVINAVPRPADAHPNFSGKLTLTDKREILPGSADGSIKPVVAPDPIFGEVSPAEAFGDLAVKLRLKAADLTRMADMIDSLALEFEQRIEDNEKKLDRFNALRALLTEA